MRWIGLLLLTVALMRAQSPALDDSRVTLTYGEFRHLLDTIQKEQTRPAPEPPISSAILSANYILTPETHSASGTATFRLQNFRREAVIIPLLGTNAKIQHIDPPDTVLVLQGSQYAALLPAQKSLTLTLQFSVPSQHSAEQSETTLTLPPSALSSLRVLGLKDSEEVTVRHAIRQKGEPNESVWQLGALDELQLVRQAKAQIAPESTKVKVRTPSIIRSAVADTRIVRDGSYLTNTTWTIRHDGPLDWPLVLPPDSQILTCQINDEAHSPRQESEDTILLNLPADGTKETKVELSYTGKLNAFSPVRGEIGLALPQTALLVETLKWHLSIPAIYEVIAVQGNVDFDSSCKSAPICLKRDLNRGDAPSVQVFYQKPETPNNK